MTKTSPCLPTNYSYRPGIDCLSK